MVSGQKNTSEECLPNLANRVRIVILNEVKNLFGRVGAREQNGFFTSFRMTRHGEFANHRPPQWYASCRKTDMDTPPAHVGGPPHAVPSTEAPRTRHFLQPGGWIALVRGRPLLPATILLTLIFFMLTGLILRADLQPTALDGFLTNEIQEFPYMPVGMLLIAVSWLGFAPVNWLLGIAVVVFMALRRWYVVAVFTGIAALGGLTAEIVKHFVARPRPTPDMARITTILNSFSFPSGHVTSYVTFFGFLFYLSYTTMPRRSPLRLPMLIFFGLMVVLVGPSRVYMGQHWASDTLAGYALGFAYLLAVIQLYRIWMHRRVMSDER